MRVKTLFLNLRIKRPEVCNLTDKDRSATCFSASSAFVILDIFSVLKALLYQIWISLEDVRPQDYPSDASFPE